MPKLLGLFLEQGAPDRLQVVTQQIRQFRSLLRRQVRETLEKQPARRAQYRLIALTLAFVPGAANERSAVASWPYAPGQSIAPVLSLPKQAPTARINLIDQRQIPVPSLPGYLVNTDRFNPSRFRCSRPQLTAYHAISLLQRAARPR